MERVIDRFALDGKTIRLKQFGRKRPYYLVTVEYEPGTEAEYGTIQPDLNAALDLYHGAVSTIMGVPHDLAHDAQARKRHARLCEVFMHEHSRHGGKGPVARSRDDLGPSAAPVVPLGNAGHGARPLRRGRRGETHWLPIAIAGGFVCWAVVITLVWAAWSVVSNLLH